MSFIFYVLVPLPLFLLFRFVRQANQDIASANLELAAVRTIKKEADQKLVAKDTDNAKVSCKTKKKTHEAPTKG